MNILAIDQSLTNSGICISSNEKLLFSNIKTTPEISLVERFAYIRDKLQNLIDINNIEIVIREGCAFGIGSGSGRVFDLGGLVAIIDLTCYDLGRKMFIIEPKTHKKFTTGAGNTGKSIMLMHVYKNWNIELKDDNIADAVSMLKTYQAYRQYLKGYKNNLSKEQIDVMKSLMKGKYNGRKKS